ncbi:BTAD domain-containing putative transcriptional regulator [Hamadaea sp. NPDC051192]|uniref:BTAD domain-containing putative transcriptional regulator n=1 Tax=Hamadaea sp. NPDC051192 TaxID=3154940 RepID=UPI00341AA7E0
MALEFRLLGDFEVRREGQSLHLGGVKPRQLLATLLLQPDQPVSMDRLVEVLWPADPPRSTAANLHTYVSALRGALPSSRILRRPPGYVCEPGPASIDTTCFSTLADEASRLRRLGRNTEALAACHAALGLWRGQVLADLPQSPLWHIDLNRLTERRLLVVEESIEVRLSMAGCDASDELQAIVAELRGLVAEHPLRERMWLLLLRTQIALGRRADALTTYADCRQILAAELGVEPGPALRQVHLSLLAEPQALRPTPAAAPRLGSEARLMLSGLAAFGDTSLPGWVAGAVLGADNAVSMVTELVAARLITTRGPDELGQRRLRVPPLVRLLVQDTPPDQAALTRALGGYLHLAEQAAGALPASQFGPGVTVAPRWDRLPVSAAVHTDPLGWFAAEHVTLLAAIDVAARADRADFAWELAFVLLPWCSLALRPDVWNRSHHTALQVCQRADDLLGTAVTLRGIGQLHLYHDEYQQAEAALTRSRLIFARLGHPAGVAAALGGLGAMHLLRGEAGQAIDYYSRAYRWYQDAGLQWGEAYALGSIGRGWLALGDTDRASAYLNDALDLAIGVGDRHRIAHLTHQLGVVSARRGHTAEAEAHFGAALDTFVAIADLHGEAYTLVELAALTGGDRQLIRALDIYQRLGDRSAEATTASRLSQYYSASGRFDLADAYHDEARRLANCLH